MCKCEVHIISQHSLKIHEPWDVVLCDTKRNRVPTVENGKHPLYYLGHYHLWYELMFDRDLLTKQVSFVQVIVLRQLCQSFELANKQNTCM